MNLLPEFWQGMKKLSLKIGCRLALGVFLTISLMFAAGCSDRRTPTGALLNSAADAARNGQWDEAGKFALKVLKRDPANADALVLHALASERLGRGELALESARKAAELYPENYAAQYTLGRRLARRPGAAAEAIVPLERALKVRPGDVNTLLLLGQCSGKINADNTIDYYRMLPLDVRARPEVQNQIAIYYVARRGANRHNLELAFKALGLAYKAAPDNPGIVLNLALFLDHHARSGKRAAGFYRRYLILTEHNPELNPTRAQVQARIRAIR